MNINLLLASVFRSNSNEDIELLKRICERDENALTRLYDLYSRMLYSFILKIVKQSEDAEEILQSLFLQVWKKAEYFNMEKGSVYSWLFTIARNRSIDKLRSKNHQQEKSTLNSDGYEFEILVSQNQGFNSYIDKETSELVLGALKRLPSEQMQVIQLAYYEGLTQNEISKMLNIPLGTVKTRTRQALIKLEDLLASIV